MSALFEGFFLGFLGLYTFDGSLRDSMITFASAAKCFRSESVFAPAVWKVWVYLFWVDISSP